VSAEARGNDEMAAMLAEEIRDLGETVEAVPGVDFPIVHGEIDSGARSTVLIHSMYDTTSATEPGWMVKPFDAIRMNFENYGECIGRAVQDGLPRSTNVRPASMGHTNWHRPPC
jgi:hypothetical protein